MTKTLTRSGLLSLLLISLSACATAPGTPPPNDTSSTEAPVSGESSIKGYELYSWEIDTNNWAYALFPGTNALKTNNTIAAKQQTPAQIVEALRALPEGSEVFWNPAHNTQGSKTLKFGLPEDSLTAAIDTVIAERKLKLSK